MSSNNGFKFERLAVWQRAMELGEDVISITSGFPSKEQYNLSSQIRRGTDYMVLYISEGAILQSSQEYKKFLGYAIRSLAEVMTCLYKAKQHEYISNDEFDKLYEFSFN